MLKGIHLTLMAGPAVPRPVPYELLDALTSATITTSTSGRSGFQLQFQLTTRSPLQTVFLLAGGASVPILRVVIVATVNGTPNVLIDGVMTNHQVTSGEHGKATLTVTGEDLSCLMDYEELSGLPFPALPAFLRVATILLKYSALGIVPKVVPNIGTIGPNPLERIPTQQGTDLAYIQQLARNAGYVFYLEAGPSPGSSTAYWGPVAKNGAAQPALTTNMDAHSNVESLSFQFTGDRGEQPIAMIQDPFTKTPIPIPIGDVSPLNPPLGAVIPIPKKIRFLKNMAKLSFAEAAESALAVASQGHNCAAANGSLDVVRYGRVLEARKLVGVRGAGAAFDGLYYVESVTHRLKRGEFKQDFTLSRNGLVSTTQRVSA